MPSSMRCKFLLSVLFSTALSFRPVPPCDPLLLQNVCLSRDAKRKRQASVSLLSKSWMLKRAGLPVATALSSASLEKMSMGTVVVALRILLPECRVEREEPSSANGVTYDG